jgi:hypothetical protein
MKRNLLIGLIAGSILIAAISYLARERGLIINKSYHKEGTTMSTATCKHSMMTKLIDDLELRALKSSPNSVNVVINSEDLLILVEYARQLEAVIKMMDDDPSRARQLYKH